jgi:hypothetical protein
MGSQNFPGKLHNIITHNELTMSLENFITLNPPWICVCGKPHIAYLTNGFMSLEKLDIFAPHKWVCVPGKISHFIPYKWV